MSNEETDEQKTYVRRDSGNQGTVVVTQGRPQPQPATVVNQAPAPASQRNETIVSRRSTNTGALVAMGIGIVVLLAGIGLVASQIKFLPWPYSIIVVIGFGLILLIAGVSMVSRGQDRP